LFVVVSYVLLAIPNAVGQQNPAKSEGSYGAVFGLDLATTAFDPASSAAQGLGTRAWGMRLFLAGSWKNVLLLGVDGTFLSPHDDSSFTNSTTGGEKRSQAYAYSFSVFGGVRTIGLGKGTPKAIAVWLGVLGGWSTFDGGRSIDSCVGCDSESLKFRGGGFVEPFLEIGRRAGSGKVKIGYRTYVGGDASVEDTFFGGFQFQTRL
jgi:hypothetical protein